MMEEQTTWKGHTFTLLVFTGIVVLCSIFFILGMLVGRAEAQKLASAAGTSRTEAKTAPKEDKPDFTFYDSVKKEDPAALQPAPTPKAEPDPEPAPATIDPLPKAAEEVPEPEPAAKPAPVPAAPSHTINYQIGAVRKAAEAQKLLDELKKKGFRAFILEPPAGDPNPFYRVQVGPFTDAIEAEETFQKLKSAKYEPYIPQPKK